MANAKVFVTFETTERMWRYDLRPDSYDFQTYASKGYFGSIDRIDAIELPDGMRVESVSEWDWRIFDESGIAWDLSCNNPYSPAYNERSYSIVSSKGIVKVATVGSDRME